jgi:hypothetical protein
MLFIKYGIFKSILFIYILTNVIQVKNVAIVIKIWNIIKKVRSYLGY